jgi:hypothetical protein
VTVYAKCFDTPRATPATRTETTERKPKSKPTPQPTDEEDAAALLQRLPDRKAIQEMLRGRSVEAVLRMICRDLGIGTNHPLWREVQLSGFIDGASMVAVFNRTWRRAATAWAELEQGKAPFTIQDLDWPRMLGTGPPLPSFT